MKLFIAKVFAYATDSAEAKGAASIGMSVASKLNGTSDWVGTYDPTAELDRRIGFITNPNKFRSIEAAEEAAAELSRKYPRGAELPSSTWSWGREMVESGVPGVWTVRYKGHDMHTDQSAVKTENVEETKTAEKRAPAK